MKYTIVKRRTFKKHLLPMLEDISRKEETMALSIMWNPDRYIVIWDAPADIYTSEDKSKAGDVYIEHTTQAYLLDTIAREITTSGRLFEPEHTTFVSGLDRKEVDKETGLVLTKYEAVSLNEMKKLETLVKKYCPAYKTQSETI